MKISKKMKRVFSIYNLAVILCVIAIIVALVIILKPNHNKKITADGVEIVQSKLSSDEEISENDAKKLAIKQFKKIGESDINEESLKVLKIQRQGKEFYYISSKENTLEIQILGGDITRINSVVIE